MANKNNNKINPVIYGIVVVIAAIGVLIFGGNKPNDDIVTTTEALQSITTTSPAEIILTTASQATAQSELQTDSPYTAYYFRNQSNLDSHYEKHGIEMGFASAEEYEAAASDVVNSPDALHKTEKEDGDDVYYIEATNEFVVVSTDGYIRTYFYPNAGKSYYDRQ